MRQSQHSLKFWPALGRLARFSPISLAVSIVLLALLLAGCSSGNGRTDIASVNPYPASAGSGAAPTNYRALATVSLGAITNKGWEYLPLGKDPKSVAAAKSILKRARPLRMGNVRGRGLGSLVQIAYDKAHQNYIWNELSADAPYALTPPTTGFASATFGGIVPFLDGTIDVPVQDPTVTEYHWTIPSGPGTSAVAFGQLPSPYALLPTSGSEIEFVTNSSTSGGFNATLNGADITPQIAETDYHRPQFTCSLSGQYQLRVVRNGVEVLNQSYLQKAPVLGPMQNFFLTAPVNSTTPVTIHNQISWDNGDQVAAADNPTWWVQLADETGADLGHYPAAAPNSPAVGDTIDVTWNILSNTFLARTASQTLSRLKGGVSGKIALSRPTLSLGKDLGPLAYTYRIFAQVLVPAFVLPYKITQSSQLPGHARRIAILNPLWTPGNLTLGNTTHFTADIVSVSFDDPATSDWSATIQLTDPKNGNVATRTLQNDSSDFKVDFIFDGLDDQAQPFPSGDAQVSIEANVYEKQQTPGSALVGASDSLDTEVTIDGGLNVTIDNVTVTPEEFDPGNTTTMLTGTVNLKQDPDATSTSIPTNVTVKVEVLNSDGGVVKTYPDITDTQIQVVWDGRSESGDVAGYGNYTFAINATADQGKASASAVVMVIPPDPDIVRITTENALAVEDDDGNLISNVYYDAATNTSNPTACSADDVAQADATAMQRLVRDAVPTPINSKFKLKVEFGRPATLSMGKSMTYQVTGTSYAIHNTLTEDQELCTENVTFGPNDPTVVKEMNVRAGPRVQVVYNILWERKGFTWQDAGQMLSYNTPFPRLLAESGQQCITLGKPTDPYDRLRIQDNVLERACIYASGAYNRQQAQNLLLRGLFAWLCWGNNGSSYEQNSFHFSPPSVGNIFLLRDFLTTGGNCDDTARFYQLHAAVLGVPTQVIHYRNEGSGLPTNGYKTWPIKGWGPNWDSNHPLGGFPSFPMGLTPSFAELSFDHHAIVLDQDNLIWDLTAGYKSLQNVNYLMGGWSPQDFVARQKQLPVTGYPSFVPVTPLAEIVGE